MKNKLTLAAVWGLFLSSGVYAQTATPLKINQAELIAKGAYLANIGDCDGCHTIANGQPYGGGRAFSTPFGTLYSTNITSDKKYGIGNYSYQQFADAIRNGIAPRGNLYPAMPYTSYHQISDSNLRALYAYFMQVKPASQPNLKNGLPFPFNIRFGLKVWNLFAFDKAVFKPNPEKSALWNRGKYLVQGLGHCSECHTPRNFMMATEADHFLEGAVVNGLNAPDITPYQLQKEHWSFKELARFLTTGQSSKGTAFDDMYIVEKHSLTHLDPQDIQAMTTYLLNENSPKPSANTQAALPVLSTTMKTTLPGYRVYMDSCSGCHGITGQGIPNVAPALRGNATIENRDIFNTVAVLINGIPQQSYGQNQAYYAMPAYKNTLSDQQIADLITFLHSSMTTQTTITSAKNVAEIKKRLTND